MLYKKQTNEQSGVTSRKTVTVIKTDLLSDLRQFLRIFSRPRLPYLPLEKKLWICAEACLSHLIKYSLM